MSQGPTRGASLNYDNLSSSPDPLAFDGDNYLTSTSARSPTKKRNQRRVSKTPAASGTIIPSSPFRAVAEQNLSPWKIRVTIEAEEEEGGSNMETTAGRRVTRTMQIPLRQDTPASDREVGSVRGRRSRSQESPSKTKRSGTPVRSPRKGAGGRKQRQSVTDLNVRPLGDDADEDDWLRRKKSPRKKKTTRAGKSNSGAEATTQMSSGSHDFEIHAESNESATATHQGRANSDSVSVSPELRDIDLNKVSVRPRALSARLTADGENHDPQNSADQLDVPTTRKTKGLDLRKVSVNRAKSYPTPSPTSSYRGDSDGIGGNPVDDEAVSHDAHNEGFDTILESEGFTMIDLDTLPSAKQYGFSSPAVVEGNHQLNGVLSESSTGATNASNQEQHPSQPEEAIVYPPLNADESDLSSTVPSSPPAAAQPAQEKGLLRVPLSDAARKVTPQPYSSPKLPSPPRQDGRGIPHHRHRGSVSALAAGIALQGVVTPKHKHSDSASAATVQEKQNCSSSSRDRQQKDENGLFQGFDCGTQRELRAGLRFGEELARRQSHSPAASGPVTGTETEVASSALADSKPEEQRKPTAVGLGISKVEYSSHANHGINRTTQVWRGENLVQRTPPVHVVPAGKPTESKQSQAQSPPRTPQNQESSYIDRNYPDTQDREREREYQLERDAIIREIENASASQVIVIDSDSDEEEEANTQRSGYDANVSADENADGYQENEDEEDEDIWLAEAKHSSSPGPEAEQTTARRSEDKFVVASKQDEDKESRQAHEVLTKRPRRSLIPSPWKRGDDIENSTFVSTATEDMSGLLFYKGGETNGGLFGAGEIKRLQQQRQRRGSGKFDIDLMAGTPKKEGEVIVQEPRFRSDRRHVDVAAQVDRTDESQSSESDGSEAGQHVGDEETLDEVGVDLETQPEAEEEAEAEAEEEEPSSSVSLVSSPSTAQPVKRVPVQFNDSSLSPGNDDGNGKSTTHQQRQQQRPYTTQRVNSQSFSPPDQNTNVNTYSYSSPQRPPTPRSALKGSRQSFAAECRERDAGNNTPTIVPSRRVVFSERSRGVDVDGLESSFSMKSSSSGTRSDESELHAQEAQGSESHLLSFVSTSSGNSTSTTAGELDGQLNGELRVQVEAQDRTTKEDQALYQDEGEDEHNDQDENGSYEEDKAVCRTVRNGRENRDKDNLHYRDDMSKKKKSEPQRASATASVSESESKSAGSKKGWTSWLWKGKEESASETAAAKATGQPSQISGSRHARHDERAAIRGAYENEEDGEDEDDESQDNLSGSDGSGWQKTKSSIASSSLSSATTLKQHANANADVSKRAPAAETRTAGATSKSRQSQSRQLEQYGNEYQSYPHAHAQSHSQHQQQREHEHEHRNQHQRQNQQHHPRRPDVEVINNTSITTRSTSRGSGSNLNLPSYLLPPSYPSDPHRSPSTPLGLRGELTNSHFRTLHIIYRKSLRPKFHAPAVHEIRPEIMALLGTEMEVDETEPTPPQPQAGRGGTNTNSSVLSEKSTLDEVFVWKIGEVECAVLERFMQECEFSQGVGNWSRNISRDRRATRRLGDNEDKIGYASGGWGWSVDQLATWLCRIVVGEVVRDEERKAREKARGRT
ncbi:hypothetical protein ABEF95_017272 [Exophiala dermatitidis]